MKREDIDTELEGAAVLEPRDVYDKAIVATSYNSNGDTIAVYGYDALVRTLVENDGMTEDEAVDWVEYNTLRSIPYMGERKPVVIWEVKDEDDVL